MYKKLDFDFQSYSTNEFMCSFNIHVSYEGKNIDFKGLKIEALSHLPGTEGFIMWSRNENGELVLLTGKNYFEHFENIKSKIQADYNFQYNCFGLCFGEKKFWITDLNSISRIVEEKYTEINPEQLESNDVAIFYKESEIIHACVWVEGYFLTKNGINQEYSTKNLEEIKSIYNCSEVRFLDL